MEQHGVSTSEIKTTVLSNASLTVPVIFGTAPVHLSGRNPVPVNVPILCRTYDEAVNAFGYSDTWEDYTICEFIYSHYKLYNLAEAIIINVLDPASHKQTVAPAAISVASGVVTLPDEGVLKNGVIVKSADGNTTYVLNTDYSLAYDKYGKLVITTRSGGTIPTNVTSLQVGYDKLNPAAVNGLDIIGGVDSTNGQQTGIELVNQIFPRFGIVPGILLAPGYSDDPTVAAVLAAKSAGINSHFKTMVAVDLDVEEIAQYFDAATWKASNHYTSERQIPCYPNVTKDGKTFRFSTQLASLICRTDTENDGIPFVSPSNHAMEIDGATAKDGSEFLLGPDQAGYLNAQGIMTAINFIGGWRAWGNRTGAYPDNTDPKDAFIPIRRMFDWLQNQVVLRTWSRVDGPLSDRLIEAIIDDHNIWLNGLQSNGAILGGRVEFIASENSTEDLMNGKAVFHLFVTPPGPAQEIDFLIEYDAQYLAAIAA